ncbi:MAG: Rne/Rng family ribonuclease [Sphingomonadaceae bacterium]
MTMRMLIDGRHREETRVAVVKGNRVEEFDFESAEHKQIKGNIYLAKVTRVEPSLQAAFVDYGGNRHGFLAFSEIHPDYYQIPKEDREALLREEAEHAAEEERLRAREDEEDEARGDEAERDDDRDAAEPSDDDDAPPPSDTGAGDDGAAENLRAKRMNLRRRYKIQDVIHRRQVLLVQVVKEERGNKGAALTTYLSLAGRYCVLMPNTTHGGGISRKISNLADRKRLKSIMAEMDLPKTMGCIVRTAGLQRTKVEIRRDFDYLARVWDGIRETTLKSAAPAEIHGDSDLIKRAIRDIYNRDIEEVIVEGEDGYRAAREYMKMLMPSHARRVKPYADPVPLFQRYGVEDQLNAMYQPIVQLKSGGYLVINPTEALVSIDINSGRSTREHGIEQTAVGTNLEAAQEIARQLRLRDMAGLVVIDFIDMEHSSNVRKVEKAMKTALADDRARIQVGRISSFGLMEMSRQRQRTGVLEASTRTCPHCEGTGLVRTASSAALSALRMIEDEAARGNGSRLTMRASQEAAIYLLNRKRFELAEIEERYGVGIEIHPDGEAEGARMSVEASGPPPAFRPKFEPIAIIEDDESDLPEEAEDDDIEEEAESRTEGSDGETAEAKRKRSRRRRGRRGRREDGGDEARADGEAAPDDAADGDGDDATHASGDESSETTGEANAKRRNRRGRRGGRGRRGDGTAEGSPEESTPAESVTSINAEPEPELVDTVVAEEPAKKARRRPAARKSEATAPVEPAVATDNEAKPKRARKAKAEAVDAVVVAEASIVAETVETVPAEKPKRKSRAKPKADDEAAAPLDSIVAEPTAPVSVEPAPTPPLEPVATETAEPAGEPRRGWWQRTFGAEG